MGKLDYPFDYRFKEPKDEGQVRHNHLVKILYHFMHDGELILTDELSSETIALFNGNGDTALKNLKRAANKLGSGFHDVEPLFKYNTKGKQSEIDVFGCRDGYVIGVEVKCKHNGIRLDEQIKRFKDFAVDKYPEKGTEIYCFNGIHGLQVKCYKKPPNLNTPSHYYHARV